MLCPHCKSDNVRRSRAHRDDGALRRLLYSAYRCRSCDKRFHRLGRGLWIGVGAVVLLVAAAGFGWGVAIIYTSDRYDTGAAAATPVNDTASLDLPSVLAPTESEGGSTAALAESGNAKAQFQLGIAYREGQSVQRDLNLAYKWFSKSAQQGYADAQFVLGAMHLSGQGVLQSFPSAFEWFEKAAQQNHAEAQYHLGRMYRRGYGVSTSHPKAYMWFNIAAAQGHERAREARDNLLPLMTPDQIKAAQQESQDWRPALGKR